MFEPRPLPSTFYQLVLSFYLVVLRQLDHGNEQDKEKWMTSFLFKKKEEEKVVVKDVHTIQF